MTSFQISQILQHSYKGRKNKSWITNHRPRTSPFSHSFMKGEYSLCLNCSCDWGTSGSLAYINARHMPLEKSWSREQEGGYWAPMTAITWWRRRLFPSTVLRSHSLRSSQPTSLPRFIPTEAIVTQFSPPTSPHPPNIAPCPRSYSGHSCPLETQCGTHCECQEIQTCSC